MRIQFKKLFGKFDYNIDTENNKLTILTGPNGFGKSTILNCIEHINSGYEGLLYFDNLDFEEIIFDNKIYLYKGTQNKLKIKLRKNKEEKNIEIDLDKLQAAIDDLYKYRRYEKISKFEWKDNIKEKIFELEYFISEYIFEKSELDSSKKIMEEIKNVFHTVYYIKEQRLFTNIELERKNIPLGIIKEYETEDLLKDEVKDLPEKMKKIISKYVSRYTAKSSELDSSYPIRLLNSSSSNSNMTKDDFSGKMGDIVSKISDLSKYNLSESSTIKQLKELSFDDKFSEALSIYFEDFEEKYQVYSELLKKLNLFMEIINEKIHFKEIVITKEEGIYLKDNKLEEKILYLEQLSSGEKQEIMMFYKLIFEMDESSLLLIDEPEISLHVAWQRKFISDLFKVTKHKNLNIIISTHSPQIIGEYSENQIDLGELYNEQL